jgi:NTP pyrophosphatase (non-canonical NTP hydrolase)
MNAEILAEIERLTELDTKSLMERLGKLTEETGEVAGAILALKNVSGSAYKDSDREDAVEECIDVLIVVRSLLVQLEASEDEIEELLQKKMKKWEWAINA